MGAKEGENEIEVRGKKKKRRGKPRTFVNASQAGYLVIRRT